MSDKLKNIIYPEVKLKDILGAFWRGISPSKWWLFLILVSMTVVNILGIIVPTFYKLFFDKIASADYTDAKTAQFLVYIIIEVAILHGAMWLLWRVANYANVIFQPVVMARLRQQAFAYLIDHSFSFFNNNFTGSLVQRVNRFARAFERIADRITYNALPLFVQIISIVVVVWFLKPLISVVILVWIFIMLVVNVLFARWKFKYDVIAAETDSKSTGVLSDAITNQNAIQLFTKTASEFIRFKNITNEQAQATKKTWGYDLYLEAAQSFFVFAIEFLLFYYSIRYWHQGIITIGVFVLIQTYLIYLSEKLWDFTRVARDVYQAYADAQEMVEIMMLDHEIKDAPGALTLAVPRGEIIFKNLTFSFKETREVLKNINITIRAGEKIAIIGPSGAGKTTFVRLIMRLYIPTAGQILIDGADIAHVTQKSLRDNVSFVPQDPVLFHRTLFENIGYGKNNPSLEEIRRASELSHSDEFIENLPYGYDTFVGERGVKLSGGERQRIAIARAILKNAPILILDEATSSLDSHSESLIQDALATLMKDKTTIVIAHRLSTIQKMDRIIVIDNGEVVEEGGHEELLKKEGSLYRKLWTLQASGFITDLDKKEEDEKEDSAEDEE